MHSGFESYTHTVLLCLVTSFVLKAVAGQTFAGMDSSRHLGGSGGSTRRDLLTRGLPENSCGATVLELSAGAVASHFGRASWLQKAAALLVTGFCRVIEVILKRLNLSLFLQLPPPPVIL